MSTAELSVDMADLPCSFDRIRTHEEKDTTTNGMSAKACLKSIYSGLVLFMVLLCVLMAILMLLLLVLAWFYLWYCIAKVQLILLRFLEKCTHELDRDEVYKIAVEDATARRTQTAATEGDSHKQSSAAHQSLQTTPGTSTPCETPFEETSQNISHVRAILSGDDTQHEPKTTAGHTSYAGPNLDPLVLGMCLNIPKQTSSVSVPPHRKRSTTVPQKQPEEQPHEAASEVQKEEENTIPHVDVSPPDTITMPQADEEHKKRSEKKLGPLRQARVDAIAQREVIAKQKKAQAQSAFVARMRGSPVRRSWETELAAKSFNNDGTTARVLAGRGGHSRSEVPFGSASKQLATQEESSTAASKQSATCEESSTTASKQPTEQKESSAAAPKDSTEQKEHSSGSGSAVGKSISERGQNTHSAPPKTSPEIEQHAKMSSKELTKTLLPGIIHPTKRHKTQPLVQKPQSPVRAMKDLLSDDIPEIDVKDFPVARASIGSSI